MSRYLTDEELDAIRKRAPMYAGGDYRALLEEVERLRVEVGMLQQEARIRKHLCDGLASEAAEERAAVVAWLRKHWSEVLEQTPQQTAKLIERGEHRREEER